MLPTQRLENIVPHLTAEQYARVVAFAEVLATQQAPSGLAATVAATRRRLGRQFSQTARLRLRALTRRSEEDTLTEAERAEYIALAEQREEADAEWITAAAQLSAMHAIPLAQALELLNLGVKRHV